MNPLQVGANVMHALTRSRAHRTEASMRDLVLITAHSSTVQAQTTPTDKLAAIMHVQPRCILYATATEILQF